MGKRQKTRGGIYAELTDSSSSSSSSSGGSANTSTSKASRSPLKFKEVVTKLKAKRTTRADTQRMEAGPRCPKCQDGLLKPDAVYFGEPLPKAVIKRAITCSKAAKAFVLV